MFHEASDKGFIFRVLQAALLGAMVIPPVWIESLTGKSWKWWIVGGYAVVVAGVHLWRLKPDRRFHRVRNPTLDNIFDAQFAKARKRVPPGKRLPFRATVMQSRGFPCFKKLKIIYSYEMKTADHDFAMSWPRGHGQAWEVFENGKFGWFDYNDKPNQFMLTPEEKEKTSHLFGVLSLPMKTQGPNPIGVLNLDALSRPAADGLRRMKEALQNSSDKAMVDLADAVSLYFH